MSMCWTLVRLGTAKIKIKTDGRLARELTSECGWLYCV